MEERGTDPTVGQVLASRERRSAMQTAIASSNPHGMTPQSTDPDWSESDPLPAMPETTGNHCRLALVAEGVEGRGV